MLKESLHRVSNLTIGEIIWGGCSVGIVWVWAIYALALLESPAVSQGNVLGEEDQEQESSLEQSESNQPKILKFELTLSEPSDLKVKRGDQVKAGDVLGDRTRIREQLLGQKARLMIAIDGIRGRTILDPPAPLPVPPLAPLPPANFEEQERAVAVASTKVDLQERKVDAIGLVVGPAVPQVVLQHERTKLETLRQELDQAQAGLAKARTDRAEQEYQHSIHVARRQEEANQAQLSYSFQLQQREEQRRDKEFQVAQLEERLKGVEADLANLGAVISPYDGVVRRVKWLGQKDNVLQVEVTLAIQGAALDPFGLGGDGDGTGTTGSGSGES